jgi:long-chain acyl-CoA synthetase
MFRPAGPVVSVLKFMLLKTLYYGVYKPLLRLETRGLENIPATGPCLVCPNHQSFIDPFVLIAALPFGAFRRMFYVGYSAFFSNPVMKVAARIAGIIPVDPDAHLLGAMQASAAGLRGGGILCIFPEGGRSFDGELMEFKKGAAILARELSVPVIPAAIAGAHAVWARGSNRIRLGKVRVVFGESFQLEESTAADPYQDDTDRLREKVSELLEKLRAAGKRSAAEEKGRGL